MENAEFDKFIRSNAQKNLEVPKELDWDNMNIPLPKKKKKSRFFFLWIVLSFLVLISFVLIYFNAIEEKTSRTDNNSISSGLGLMNPVETTAKKDSLDIRVPSSVNNENVKANLDAYSQRNTNQLISQKLRPFKTISNLAIANLLNLENLTLSDSVEASTFSSLKTHEKIDLIPSIPTLTYSVSPSIKNTELESLSIISPVHKEIKTGYDKRSTLSLSIGSNTFTNSYNSGFQIQELESAEAKAFGLSYNLGFEYLIKKGFFASVGVSYQRLHNTFTFSEELEVEENSLQRIYRTKYVYYNNYFDIMSLNIGVGKSILFGKKWGSKMILNIQPSYTLNVEGRSLNDQISIIDVKEDPAQQKLFLAIGAELRLFYKLKSNEVFVSYGYQQAITDSKLIKNSSLKYKPQISSINVGMSRSF